MTGRFRIGLGLAGLLGAADVVALAATDGEDPPYAVAAIGAVLGLLTLAGVVLLWRGGRRTGWFWTVVVSRTLSAISAVPAFFAGVPAGLAVAVAVSVVLTAAALWLLFTTRPSATA